ncbi:UNVERIFIED_CONTAM: hypothetical protein FKN15_068286 [Acipenser sinensis]
MATVVMEQIGRLFINVQQIRQIPQLLETAIPTLPGTVKDCEVPWVFREPHILSGYRPHHQNWRYYCLTLFQRHNEAVNIWTHLVAALVVLVKFRQLSEMLGPGCLLSPVSGAALPGVRLLLLLPPPGEVVPWEV